ncbi:MAG: polyphosphate--AMP phosphotransferase [Eggerthellaceae bacterium]|jgi:polyphosphate kinase 2 (PPK2 family)
MLDTIDFDKPKLPKEEYKPLHDELIEKLVVLQQQARAKGIGVVVLFEGWAGAGKGSRISDLMYELDARATNVYVTEDCDPKEELAFPGRPWGVRGYYPMMQQFWKALGPRGNITFYDRGWYTAIIEQALAERFGKFKHAGVLKEAKKAASENPDTAPMRVRRVLEGDVLGNFQKRAYNFEKMLSDDGYLVIKIFVHVSKKAQSKRLKHLRENPDTAWRVSDAKLAQAKEYDTAYPLYDTMLEMSNFAFAPWTIINGEDKRQANIDIARTLVDALEGALARQPSEADVAAAKKALSNSQAALSGDAGAAADKVEAADVRAAAEAEAARQHACAPASSRFVIMAGYPHIDHTKPGPVLENDDDYGELLDAEQRRFYNLELEMYQKRVPLMLMYEGWDAAGKGGNIKRVAQALDARSYTIFPSPAPTKPELMHPHLWRYWTRLPKAGHVGIYDRSWYGRVLVERVEGFASTAEWARAYDEINEFEYELVQWGAILLKFWVDVTPDEQLRRFKAREQDESKRWKITDEDWRNRDKYPQYKAAVDDMFRLTSTPYAPWILLQSDNKHYARIKALRLINDALEARLHG